MFSITGMMTKRTCRIPAGMKVEIKQDKYLYKEGLRPSLLKQTNKDDILRASIGHYDLGRIDKWVTDLLIPL